MGIWNDGLISVIKSIERDLRRSTVTGGKDMSDFFDGIGRKLSEVADDLGRKAEETLETQKIKSQIRTLKRENEKEFSEMGRMLYEQFQRNELQSTDYISFCESIEAREEQIKVKEEELEKIKEAI